MQYSQALPLIVRIQKYHKQIQFDDVRESMKEETPFETGTPIYQKA